MQLVDVTGEYFVVDFDPKLKFVGDIMKRTAYLLLIFGEHIIIIQSIMNWR